MGQFMACGHAPAPLAAVPEGTDRPRSSETTGEREKSHQADAPANHEPLPPEPGGDQCTQTPIELSPECAAWSRAQASFAALALEALKLGRIDPWLYEVDAKSSTLRVDKHAVPDLDKAKYFAKALADVNADTSARELLVAAHERVTREEGKHCPAKTYAVDVTEDSDAPAGQHVYHWRFTGKDVPPQARINACFKGLYAAIPEGCLVLSRIMSSRNCIQTSEESPAPEDTSVTSRGGSMMVKDISSTLGDPWAFAKENSASAKRSALAVSCAKCTSCGYHGKINPTSGECATCP
jgi:hypothetical protein